MHESNRRQAADIRAKLSAIGYEFAPMTDWDADLFEFSGEQLETLARGKHDRWLKERLLAGWRYGPVRDAHARRSPFLVPWEELTEEVRELDRDAGRLIPSLLAAAGFAIVPLQGRADPASAAR